MRYEFSFTITHNDLFNYSMNHTKYSKTFLFDVIFTIVSFIILIYSIVMNNFMAFSTLKKCVIIFCCLLFPVIQPLIIYLKTIKQANKLANHIINLVFDDEMIIASTDNERSETTYGNVYNFIKYKNMIVIMYNAALGQIIPNRVFNVNREDFFTSVSNKIKEARLKNQENESKKENNS